MERIILDGKKRECKSTVKTWEEHGMTFEGKANTCKRVEKPSLIIWHWTGGENPASTVYETLIRRRLGVEFCIDIEGIIWQFVDPLLWDPQDTSGAEGHRSISIEIVNYGFAWKKSEVPVKGRDRIVDNETIHTNKLRVARFWPDQITAVENLTITLCDSLNIPKKFPKDKNGKTALHVLTPEEQKNFTGIMGHFHKTTQKFDPGFHIFKVLEHLEA